MSEHPAAEGRAAPHEHASIGTYFKVAGILCAVTLIEYLSIYIRALTPILTPLLLVLSAGKFALVVLFFMHLRYDSRTLTLLFIGPMVIAIALIVALMTLPGDFLVFGR